MANIKEADRIFYIGESPKESLARVEFRIVENILSIDYVEVSWELRGQGIGKELIDYTVEYARKNHLKIVPICSYARYQLEIHLEYHDVLDSEKFKIN